MEVSDILNDVAAVVADENPIEKIFIPTWDNKPPELPPVISLNGEGVLTWQNLSAVIAAQGMGKSSICEALLASYLNPNCDALGWEVDPTLKGIIYVDFERTNTDVWNSFSRMARRAGISRGTIIDTVILVGMRSIPRLEQRKQALIQLLETRPCSLLVLDGAGDLITDSNDLLQAIECRIWVRELTVMYGVSIFTTLHPNPGTLKPRGHIGSEIMREAEAVMAIKKEGDTRVIHSEFEHGKNRNGAPIWGAYAWDEVEMMHCRREVPSYLLDSTSGTSRSKQKKPSDFDDAFHHDLLTKVFSKSSSQKSGEFHQNLAAVWESDPESDGNMNKTRAEAFRSYYILMDYLVAKSGQKGNSTINELAPKYQYPRELIEDL